MYTTVRIQGDPTPWIVADADATTIAQSALDQGGPVAVGVVAPLLGRLILSPLAVATIALRPIPVETGWVPSYIHAPAAHIYLYVPSPTGPTDADPGYQIASGQDLDEWASAVLAAINDRTVLPVDTAPDGSVLLNGATLTLAVVYAGDASG